METLQCEVLGTLYTLSVEGLEKVYEHLGIPLGEQESKLQMAKRIVEFLEVEEEKQHDGGLHVYRGVQAFLSQLLAITGEAPSSDNPTRAGGSSTQVTTSTAAAMTRDAGTRERLTNSVYRKDFKISGQLGEPGQKDRLTYSSLTRQIDSGLKQGYTQEEIKEAVLRAMGPSVEIRSYMEKLDVLTLPMLREMLQSHYEDKSATELYQELCNLSQMPKEDPQNFLIRALNVRQTVLFASRESGSGIKYSPELVQGMFLHALHTGLVSDAIRQELQPLLQNPDVSDIELIRKMRSASSAETERASRLRNRVRSHQVEVSQCAPDVSEFRKPGKPNALTEVKDEVRELRAEIATISEQLKQQELRPPARKGSNVSNESRARGCPQCRERGKGNACTHCFFCGSDEQYFAGCLKRKQKSFKQNGPSGNGSQSL